MAYSTKSKVKLETKLGSIIHSDSLEVLKGLKDESVSLIMTSPPYGLSSPKEYGNVHQNDYLDWFWSFAKEFKRVLKDDGSLVIDIGGTWNKGAPTRSIYHFKLLIMLVEELGLNLAQEFYWWNPSKLPSPAEWVNIRRLRVKDSVNPIWWLSKSKWPKSSNTRILQPYSKSMERLIERGDKNYKRPSGHDITTKFTDAVGGSIPHNILAIANTESKSFYHEMCRKKNIQAHPARFPVELPDFFIRYLTDKNDLVLDPFAGSCTTGFAAESLGRKWICVDSDADYLKGALYRFDPKNKDLFKEKSTEPYSLNRLGNFVDAFEDKKLDGRGEIYQRKISKLRDSKSQLSV